MAHVTLRPARLPDPRAGLRLWRSNPDDPGVLLLVTYEGGLPVAYVHEGEDIGELLQVKEMGGTLSEPARVS